MGSKEVFDTISLQYLEYRLLGVESSALSSCSEGLQAIYDLNKAFPKGENVSSMGLNQSISILNQAQAKAYGGWLNIMTTK